MIRSMTAFANGSEQYDWGTLTWEIRSVNHRYLDINLRLPDELRTLEMSVRELIAKCVQRGKLDCTLRFKTTSPAAIQIQVNETLAQAVINAGQVINKKLHQPSEMNPLDILRWPGVVHEPERDMQTISQSAIKLFNKTLAEFIACREREGERLLQIIQQRCTAMADVVAREKQRRPDVIKTSREKMQQKITELATSIEANRFEQEVALLIQKMDVDEELDRLTSHFAEIRDIFSRNESVGRRLDFIMQELNREANTLGSKSVDMATTQASVELKVLIEQMREQIQNIE